MNQSNIDDKNKALRDFPMPMLNANTFSIRRPSIECNHFKINLAIIIMISKPILFGGLTNNNTNSYIASLLEIYDTFESNKISNDAIRLRFFHSI